MFSQKKIVKVAIGPAAWFRFFICTECGAVVLKKYGTKHVEMHLRIMMYKDVLDALVYASGIQDPVSHGSTMIDFEEMPEL